MEQDLIGQSPNAKLRLGLVNTKGQQKGVDSLIVTDLIELARNQAITDALILSGDEDIKIGVQVVQTSYGVRIHHPGIKPAKGSQSDGLMMEADTCHEWNESIVRDWMHFVDLVTDATRASVSVAARHDDSGTQYSHSLRRESEVPDEFLAIIASESATVISTLAEPDLTRHVAFLKENPGRIHHDLDRRFLARMRNRFGRDLTDQERKEYRRVFAEALRTAHSGTRPR